MTFDAPPLYLWQNPDWPAWRYDLAALMAPLAEVSQAQGRLLGRLADVGWDTQAQAQLIAVTSDVLKTSEIEGEPLDLASVRSSVARRLGVDIGALAPADRQVEGVVEMVLDATTRCTAPLTAERLLGWHAALFPTGYSGLSRIRVGAWRDDAQGPMQVVSGPLHRQKVHDEAPPAARLPDELAQFLAWANADAGPEPWVLKAGLAHLWFVTLHPLDDGNGRVARAVGNLFLARAEQGSADPGAPSGPGRCYSPCAQIQREREDYYAILERTQKSTLDVTAWLVWFLGALHRAIEGAHHTLDGVLARARFWQRWAQVSFNPRQRKVLARLLDDFEGKLTTRKWAALAKCSDDTALRDIGELLAQGILQRLPGGGRSAAYALCGRP